MDPYHAFLDFVVKALVDHPEDVVIVKSVDNLGVLLTLTVHPDDMGKVIGRQGKIATQAIRPLLTAEQQKKLDEMKDNRMHRRGDHGHGRHRGEAADQDDSGDQ